MTISKFCALVLMALLFSAAVSMAAAKTVTIAVDVSGSNRLIESPAYAMVAAKYVQAAIAQLQLGDWVHVRRFGERKLENLPIEKIRIDRQHRPRDVAVQVGRYIASLPAKTAEGDGSTSIVAFLEFGHFDCANGGKVVLLTDAIESEVVNPKDLFAGKLLPAPEPGILKGCDVEMLGFGNARDGALPVQAIKAMRKSWNAWMSIAGASKFDAIIDP